MTSRSDGEGLEVLHPHPGLEYDDRSASIDPYRRTNERDTPYTDYTSKQIADVGILIPVEDQDPPQKRICGLRRRTFWLVTALLMIAVLAAAIGGGVGGSLVNRNKTNTTTSPNAQAISSSSLAPSVSSSTKTPTSTTTIVGPSMTLLRDCPSSNNTVYTVRLGAAEQQYRKQCNTVIRLAKRDGDNFVNQFVASLDDCIGLCAQWNVNDHKSPSGLAQTCGAVCWRNNLQNDHPGSCFGYAITNSSSLAKSDINCDSAVWINGP